MKNGKNMTNIGLKTGQRHDVRANVLTFQGAIKKIFYPTSRRSREVKIQRCNVETQCHDIPKAYVFFFN